jgi:hypothetical protein
MSEQSKYLEEEHDQKVQEHLNEWMDHISVKAQKICEQDSELDKEWILLKETLGFIISRTAELYTVMETTTTALAMLTGVVDELTDVAHEHPAPVHVISPDEQECH